MNWTPNQNLFRLISQNPKESSHDSSGLLRTAHPSLWSALALVGLIGLIVIVQSLLTMASTDLHATHPESSQPHLQPPTIGLASVTPDDGKRFINQESAVPAPPHNTPRESEQNDLENTHSLLTARQTQHQPNDPPTRTIEHRVDSGETLETILRRYGVSFGEIHAASKLLEKSFNPKDLKPDQKLTINLLDPPEGSPRLRELRIVPDRLRTISVLSDPQTGKFAPVHVEKTPTAQQNIYLNATIETSLIESAIASKIPTKVVYQLIDLFSFEVDFARDIRSGDHFAVLFQEQRLPNGDTVSTGDVLMIEMTLRGKTRRYYRFQPPDRPQAHYFDLSGRSIRKALMRTPVPGARVSSGYGRRKHPVLGYSRMHRGVDFAASVGTPIYAAGDGIISVVGHDPRGYGRYVKIRHAGGYKTLYAHMSRYARGLHVGQRVGQREIIGYVGSTGLSTGPHLHYEIHRNDSAINPAKISLPSIQPLEGDHYTQFLATVSSIRHIAQTTSQQTFEELGFASQDLVPVLRPHTQTVLGQEEAVSTVDRKSSV